MGDNVFTYIICNSILGKYLLLLLYLKELKFLFNNLLLIISEIKNKIIKLS